MRLRLVVRLTALVLCVGVAYLLITAAVEYRRLAADLDDNRRREAALERATTELQYEHAAKGVLHSRPAETQGAGRSIVAVEVGASSGVADL